MIKEDVQRCFKKICVNYGIQAGLNMSGPLRSRDQFSLQVVFIDMMIASYFSVADCEILSNILQEGIKSKKDYRKLRSLVRLKILNALRQIQELAEDGIRNLGAKV